MKMETMTVAQLRQQAEERGITIPKGARKAEIIALLEEEPTVVEAEVIEETEAQQTEELAVTYNPGAISANFDALEARVDELLQQYEGWEPSAENKDDVEQCARERKYLNGLAKQIDERRKAVKNAYEQPLKQFEARCNGIRDKIKVVSGRINAVEKEADEYRKAEKKNELREHYEAFAGVLLDVVPYEKIHYERWLNKGYQIQKAKHDIEDAVERIAKEWEQLKSMNLEFHADAEARYFDSLDLGEAIAWAGKLADDKRKIEAMKAELEPVAEPEIAEPVNVPEKAYEPDIEATPYVPDEAYAGFEQDTAQPVMAEPVPMQPIPAPIPAQPIQAMQAEDIEKEGVIADIAAILQGYKLSLLKNLLDALQTAQRPTGEVSQRVMVIDAASQEQLNVIGKFCGLAGVTGTFKSGSLAEVVARENAMAAQRMQQGVYQYGA